MVYQRRSTTNNIKAIIAGIKWTTIILIGLSGWIAFAWLKADLWPNRIDPLPIHRRVEIVAQKPGKGQEWATYEGAKVRFLQDKQTNTNRDQRDGTVGSGSGNNHENPSDVPRSAITSTALESMDSHANGSKSPSSPAQAVLPLGKFLVPTGGRDPLWVIPELDPVSGETKLQVEPAGGYARFGGERYAFMDLSYQRLLQSDMSLSSAPSLSVGLHQDLGRIGRLELMAEGWLQASVLENQLDRSVELGVGVRLRVALPF